MEVKLDSLIERIKQEGVDQAKKDSDEILKQAKNTALEIVAKAKAESEALLEKTKKSAEQLEKNAKAAVNQAARDTVLVVREKLNLICDRAFKKKIEQSLSVDFLQAVITKIIDGWAQGKEVEILLNKRDVSALGEGLLSELRQELKKTVVIKVD
ncbi:MAG: hypothetical protein PHV17_10295, partial [Candidatus Omnitrophica bacterium]|nr:hypothetical protein [Candidatus Omnitrophota bacterium]